MAVVADQVLVSLSFSHTVDAKTTLTVSQWHAECSRWKVVFKPLYEVTDLIGAPTLHRY